MSQCGVAYLILRERLNSTEASVVNSTDFAQEFPDEQFPSSYQIANGLWTDNQPIDQRVLISHNISEFL